MFKETSHEKLYYTENWSTSTSKINGKFSKSFNSLCNKKMKSFSNLSSSDNSLSSSLSSSCFCSRSNSCSSNHSNYFSTIYNPMCIRETINTKLFNFKNHF